MTAIRRLALFGAAIALLVGLGMTCDAQAQSMFIHQIPLKIPKGTNGMQPELGLVFEPNAGNDIVGLGWQLTGLSVITRTNYGNGINYLGRDTYAHSQLGVLVAQGDGSLYRSKTESFTKLVPSGTCGDGPCSWTAYDRSGNKFYYGTTTDSSLSVWFGDIRFVRTWALARVEDLFGNYYEIAYTNDSSNGMLYPSVIIYTKGPGLTPHRTVQFDYEARSDKEPGYSGLLFRQTTKRLNWISILSSNTLVRKYRLDYEYGSLTGRSHLIAIQEYGSNGNDAECSALPPPATCALPPQTFEWQQGSNILTTPPWTVAGSDWGSQGYQWVADFNGDGKTDIATLANGTLWVANSAGSAFSAQTPWQNSVAAGGGPTAWLVGDFNGDGKADLLSNVNGVLYVHLANLTGSGFTQQPWQTAPVWGSSGYQWAADFNGDGLTDVAVLANGTVWVWLSTGTSFQPVSPWQSPVAGGGGPSAWLVGDFNGDGRADLASNVSGELYVHLSSGAGFDQQPWQAAAAWGAAGAQWAVDLNGDGLTDIATIANGTLWVWLSTGTGFLPASPWATNAPGSYWFSGDFDGDGKADIAGVNGNYLTYYCSTGSGFRTELYSTGSWYPGWIWSGDFNGDGMTDLASGSGDTVFMKLSDRPIRT